MLKKSASAVAGKSASGTGSTASGASAAANLMFAKSESFDMSLLPEFELVKKYFGLSIFYGISNSDGFLFEFNNSSTGGR